MTNLLQIVTRVIIIPKYNKVTTPLFPSLALARLATYFPTFLPLIFVLFFLFLHIFARMLIQ